MVAAAGRVRSAPSGAPSPLPRAGRPWLVRAIVVDDLALAQALADAGVPVGAFADAGEGALRYRMYPEGPASLVEGWTKNLAAGAGSVATAAGPADRAVGRRRPPRGHRPRRRPGAATLFAYAVYVVQAAVLFRRAGRFGPLAAIAYPLPLLAFVALFVRSAAIASGAGAGDLAGPAGGRNEAGPAVLVDAVVWAGWGTVVGWAAPACRAVALRGRRSAYPHPRLGAPAAGSGSTPGSAGGKSVPRAGRPFRWGLQAPDTGPGRHRADRLAVETRRAELVHWAAPWHRSS